MKKFLHTALPVLGLLAAVAVFLTALLLDGRIPDPAGGLLYGLGGVLFGLSVTALSLLCFGRSLTPAQRREAERSERDERNVAIREKAALSSWYWSLFLFGALFFLALAWGTLVQVFVSAAAAVLHSVFYLINVGRWSKKI